MNAATAPPFYNWAHGGPKMWNSKRTYCYWNKHVKKNFEPNPVPDAVPDAGKVLDFLHLRTGPDGKDLSTRFSSAEPRPELGPFWFSFSWLKHESSLRAVVGECDWHSAYHGSKFESVYSVSYWEGLLMSKDSTQGHNFFPGHPAIYVHKEFKKCLFYTRFTPLCGEDGLMYRPVWEVTVDRRRKIHKPNTDQWLQQPGSVIIKALLVEIMPLHAMQDGWSVCQVWNPALEGHPHHLSDAHFT